MPEPGRMTAPYWIQTEEEGRKAVQELAARKVDMVKIWVDDWRGKYKKLTPEIYGAIIDEAHKSGLRVSAHLFDLEDAKGLIRANLDAFAHGVRDKDIDDEFVAMWKQRPNLVLIPNLPDRGVKTDLSWLKGRHVRRRAGKAREGQRRQPADATRSSTSRRATWRGWPRRVRGSPWAPTATGRGVRTTRWRTWWRPA